MAHIPSASKLMTAIAPLLLAITLLPGPARADADTMTYLTHYPTANAINGIWQADVNNMYVYFVGEGGTIASYYGGVFSIADTPTNAQLNAIHGIGNNDIWTVGGDAMLSPTDPARCVILHYGGPATSWAWESVTPPKDQFDQYFPLNDVWADGAGTVYAVGNGIPRVAKSTSGGAWVYEDVGNPSNWGFNSVYGFASDDVYLSGGCGMIYHWNGSAWTLERTDDPATYCPSINTGMVLKIWGPDADNVFAVTNGGSVLKRNPVGGTWAEVTSGADGTSLYAISGSSGTDMYFTGAMGVTKHYDGSTVTTLPASSDTSVVHALFKGTGPSYTQYWMGLDNGGIVQFDGTTRTELSTRPGNVTNWEFVQRTDRVWLSADQLLTDNAPIYVYNGETLTPMVPGFTTQMRVTMLRAHSNRDVVISGYSYGGGGNLTRRYNGSSWVLDPDVGSTTLVDEVKSGPVTARIAASGWDEDYDAYLGQACVGAVCTSSSNYKALGVGTDGAIYAVGKSGIVGVYSGGTWSEGYHGLGLNLYAVAGGGGQVCAVGDHEGIVCKSDGGGWSTTHAPTGDLFAKYIGIAYAGNNEFVAAMNTGNSGPSYYIGGNRGYLYRIVNKVFSAVPILGGVSGDGESGATGWTFLGLDSNGDGETLLVGAHGLMYGNTVTPTTDVNLAPVNLLLLD